MDINGKIIELLVASGNVSKEKVEQARKLAETLKWEDENASQHRVRQTACTCCEDNGCQPGCMCYKGDSE
jgi:hypothetical protein